MRVSTYTNSELKTFRKCQRLHWISYEEGWRPAESSTALSFGTLVHVGLEAWWHSRDEPLRDAMIAMGKACEGMDLFEAAKASALIEAYHAFWQGSRMDFSEVEVEVVGTAPVFDRRRRGQRYKIRRNAQFGFKVDALATFKNQRVIIEHKTTSEDIGAGAEYFQSLLLDSQVSMYVWGVSRSSGPMLRTVLYDVIRKPAIRPKLATPVPDRRFTKDGSLDKRQREVDQTPAEYRAEVFEWYRENAEKAFRRVPVARIDEQISDFLDDSSAIIRQIEGFRKRKELPPRNPDACYDKYRTRCPFFSHCAIGEPLENNPRLERVSNIHAELETEES